MIYILARLILLLSSYTYQPRPVHLTMAEQIDAALPFGPGSVLNVKIADLPGNYLGSTVAEEIIWFSERDNWGRLYLYDLKTGALKNPITSGEGNASQIVRIDEKARLIWFVGVGKEAGREPYFRHLYRVGFDGKNQALLTPEDADHEITLSPSGRLFIDSYSKPDVPPVTILRDASSGKLLASLEKADIGPLLAAGWKPPVPFTVKARDGVTDLYGLMFNPTDFDPAKKYPIVNNIYLGPQSGSVGSRSFSPARGDTQALAELGFVIDWLVKKPGAFENYRYRDDLYPTSRFRVAADALQRDLGAGGTREYLGILQLAAHESEVGVDDALRHLIDRGAAISLSAVSAIVHSGDPLPPPTAVTIPDVNLSSYDALLGGAGWR